MKKIYFWLLIGILSLSIPAFGQNVIVVEPDPGIETGALNKAIEAVDTNDLDNTIFELRRDGLYVLNGAISHTGGTLHIRAEEGAGHRPILQPGVDINGESEVLLRPGAGLHLEGLYLYSNDELGNKPSQHIRSSANNSKFVIEDCYFDYSWQSVFRSDGIDNSIFVNNCIVRNTWRSWNPANGYFIDIRGTTEDTIVLTNNTLYNNGRDFTRMDNGMIQYYVFDQNTVYAMNLRGFETDRLPIVYCNFRLDLCIDATVTNNIFYNVAWMMATYRHDAMFYMDSVYTQSDDAARSIDVSHNNWYTEQRIGDSLAVVTDAADSMRTYFAPYDTERQDTIWWKYVGPNDNLFWNQEILDTSTIYMDPPVIWHFIKNGQVDTTDIFREELTFENPCPLNLNYWKWYADHDFDRHIMEELTPPETNFVDEDFDQIAEVTEGRFDFSYNADSRSATAAKDGGQLGDRRWPLISTSTEKISAPEARVRAFPNPFTDNVTFEFESLEHSSVRINVYDVLGKVVYSERIPVTQGKNSIYVDLGGISNSGIYLYQIQSELSNGVKSIGYGKFIKH